MKYFFNFLFYYLKFKNKFKIILKVVIKLVMKDFCCVRKRTWRVETTDFSESESYVINHFLDEVNIYF
jgi:hypothetical protein